MFHNVALTSTTEYRKPFHNSRASKLGAWEKRGRQRAGKNHLNVLSPDEFFIKARTAVSTKYKHPTRIRASLHVLFSQPSPVM